MTVVRTGLSTVESARRERVEPTGGITATNAQKALEALDTGTLKALTLTMPAVWTVTGSPTSGNNPTIAIDLATQAANLLWASPSSGGAAKPTFRAMVAADFQTLSPTWTGNHIFNPTAGDAITVNPAAASTARGIVVTQTGAGASIAGPIAFNLFDITNAATSSTAGSDGYGLFNKNIGGIRVNFSANANTTVQEGLLVAGRLSLANAGDTMGLNASMYSNIASTGAIYGVVGNASIGPTGSGSRALGAEFDVSIATGGTAPYRIGANVTSYGNVAGSTLDSGIVISANPLQAPGIGFSKGITLSNIYGVAPIATTGDWFYVDSLQTIANVFNAGNLIVTGQIFSFPNFSVTNTNAQNATTQINLTNTSTGTGASVQSQYTNATNSLTVGIGGTGLTGTYQGAGFITANGTAPLIVGTSGNAVVQFFANNAEKARLNTSGQLAIGSTNPQTLLTISANAAATPSVAPLTGSNLWLVGKDAAFNNGLTFDQYGGQASNANDLSFRQARGTAASPTASALNDTLGQFRFWGYTGSTFYRTAALFVTPNETFSGTAGGADLSWYLTPNTTQALAQSVTFKASGGLVVGASALDPGVGKIMALNAYNVGANQVVGARITGYTAMTGSPDKATAYATSTVTLAQLAGRVAQLQADLTTHGLIGA